jgi:hypothetical protein
VYLAERRKISTKITAADPTQDTAIDADGFNQFQSLVKVTGRDAMETKTQTDAMFEGYPGPLHDLLPRYRVWAGRRSMPTRSGCRPTSMDFLGCICLSCVGCGRPKQAKGSVAIVVKSLW